MIKYICFKPRPYMKYDILKVRRIREGSDWCEILEIIQHNNKNISYNEIKEGIFSWSLAAGCFTPYIHLKDYHMIFDDKESALLFLEVSHEL